MSNNLDLNGLAIAAALLKGRVIMGYDGTTIRAILVNAAGAISVVVTPGPPGGDVQTGANTAIAAAATAVLPAPPANTRTQMVSVINSPAAFVVVRKSGGAAGTGVPVVNFGIFTYSEGIAQLEAENISAAAASVGIQWETN